MEKMQQKVVVLLSFGTENGTGQDTGRGTDVDDVVEDDARRRGHIRLWVIEIDGRRVGGRGGFQVQDYSGRNVQLEECVRNREGEREKEKIEINNMFIPIAIIKTFYRYKN